MSRNLQVLLIIGLVFLFGVSATLILDNGPLSKEPPGSSAPVQPADNDPEPSPTEPVEEEPAQPQEPADEPTNPEEPADDGDDPVPYTPSSSRMSWYYIPNTHHLTPGIPDSARFALSLGGIFVGDTTQKVIYLTFDEGYENGYTSRILDTLKLNSVPAAFFVTKSYVDNNPGLVRRMAAEGHTVGNHTATHPSLPALTEEQLWNEITETEASFNQVTGSSMSKYIRPPMGEYSELTMYRLNKMHFKTVFWSMAYRDWDVSSQKGAEYAYSFVMNNVHPGAVILLHAVSSSNTEALGSIINSLKSEGYRFSLLP